MDAGGLAGITQAVVLPEFRVRLVNTNGGPGCACNIRDASSAQASEGPVQQSTGACAQLQERESHPAPWGILLCSGIKTPPRWLKYSMGRDGLALQTGLSFKMLVFVWAECPTLQSPRYPQSRIYPQLSEQAGTCLAPQFP